MREPLPFDLSSGDLSLDFSNTWGDRQRPASDRLRGYRDLLRFAEQAGILRGEEVAALAARARAEPAAAEAALVVARELREDLYRALSPELPGGEELAEDPGRAELEALNRLLREASAYLGIEACRPDGSQLEASRLERAEAEGAGGAFRWRWQDLGDHLESPLWPISRAAAELLTRSDRIVRVKECRGHRCTWLFLDTSRNRSRRWCSMEVCGNRAKARRSYRRRTRGGTGP